MLHLFVGVTKWSSAIWFAVSEGDFDTESILTSLNADFYEFKISDEKEVLLKKEDKKDTKNTKNSKKKKAVADLEPIE